MNNAHKVWGLIINYNYLCIYQGAFKNKLMN